MTSLWGVFHAFASAYVLFLAFTDRGPQYTYHSFGHYVRSFNKTYDYGTEEHYLRENIFNQTLKVVESLNQQRSHAQSAVYGINRFADMTPEEFKDYAGLKSIKSDVKRPLQNKENILKNKNTIFGLPRKIDWRDRKVITPVNDQRECGACWAFSTIETIEAMYALKHNVLEKWSVQQLLDCATDPNYGCEGGDTCSVIEWMVEKETKLVLDKDYPFNTESSECRTDIKSKKTVRIASNFTCDNFVDNELLMLLHLAYHGPLIAAVDATDWQYYMGGVLQNPCVNETNHAVQVVGYDFSGLVPYYIVRNSWGESFGNGGYLNIAVGENACCIADEVSSVDVI